MYCVYRTHNNFRSFISNRQHPHKLSTKNKILEGGIYALRKQINGSAIIEFKDIGIVAIKKQDIKTSLEERLKMKVDPTNGRCFSNFKN